MLWQHESTTKQDGRHVYFSAPQGMLGQTITMHDVTAITMHDVTALTMHDVTIGALNEKLLMSLENLA